MPSELMQQLQATQMMLLDALTFIAQLFGIIAGAVLLVWLGGIAWLSYSAARRPSSKQRRAALHPTPFTQQRRTIVKRYFAAIVRIVCLAGLFALGTLLEPGNASHHAGFVRQAQAQEHSLNQGKKFYCSNGTVKGTYNFTANGFVYPGLPDLTQPAVPFTSIGTVFNDGAGNSSYRANANTGAQGTPTMAVGAPVNGAYKINANCTGTATFPNNETYFLVVTEEGQEFFFISTVPGTVITGTGRRQEPAPAPNGQPAPGPFPRSYSCSAGSLNGTYALIGQANDFRIFPNFLFLPPGLVLPPQGVALGAVNIQYFDGAGNSELLVEVDSNGGFIESTLTDPNGLPPPTKYSVNADCTGTYRSFAPIEWTLVVLDGGREFRVLPATPGLSGFLTWKKISDGKL